MYESNIQRLIMDRGKVDRVVNQRETHATRHQAFDRVFNAKNIAGKPKQTIYYHDRCYTVTL